MSGGASTSVCRTDPVIPASITHRFAEGVCRAGTILRYDALPGVGAGWTVRYTTDLTDEVWFYLRGEEYSAQIDYFAESVRTRRLDGENSFASALETDRVVAMMLGDATARPAATAPAPAARTVWSRLFG